MMKGKMITKIGAILLATLASMSQAREVILNNDPVRVVLPLSQEIRIEFPEMVLDLNIPSETDEHLNTLLTPKGVLYWKAKSAFKQDRVIATTAAGDVILLDVSFQKDGLPQEDAVLQLRNRPAQTVSVQPTGNAPATVNDPILNTQGMPEFLAREMAADTVGSSAGDGSSGGRSYSYADLAAFAFQHYLGPERLISDLPASRIKARAPRSNKFLRVWADRVQLKVLNGWVHDGTYITAVQVRNISATPLSFDPRAIRGRYRFVATLRETLAPFGDKDDTTIWVFITDQPFNKAAGG